MVKIAGTVPEAESSKRGEICPNSTIGTHDSKETHLKVCYKSEGTLSTIDWRNFTKELSKVIFLLNYISSL